MRAAVPALVVALALVTASAQAELFPYEATLELRVSAGQALTSSVTIVDATFTGVADVVGGVVRIPAADLSTPVSALSGFGGVLVNGALTLSVGGAGAGATCPLVLIQERCIPGGGFGGIMALSGVTQLGQDLGVWGAGASATGMTSLGLTRLVQGTRWTTGVGEAWYFVPESDPTPFLLSDAGTFAGLPSTHTAPGTPGFRIVTPMIVTGSMISSIPNARGVARLTVRFPSRPVPLFVSVALAGALGAMGYARLRARS